MLTGGRPKNVALIGAGMVARTHIAACAASRTVALRGIASRSGDSARALADEADVSVYGSIAEISADPAIDFAIVATPPNVRLQIVEPLAAAGKPILLEKPLGRNSAEAEAVVAACRDAGVPLGVVFQHRARAASRKAAQLVESGALGPLGVAEFHVPWWRDQSYYDEPGRGTRERDGGGVLISQAIHTIDLGLSLTGPVRAVTAIARTSRFHAMETEDFVAAGLDFAGGATGALVASTASFPGGPERIALQFEKAALTLEAGVLRVAWRDGRTEEHGATAGTGGGADPMAFTHDWHQAVIENFAQVVDGTAEPLASGADALAAHRLIDAILRSSQAGRTETLT